MSCIIAYPNRIDECTLSGGSWTAAYPLDLLKDRVIKRAARSQDLLAASTQLVVALTKSRLLRVIAIANHNLALDSTYRIRMYADAGLTELLHDTGVQQVWPAIYPTDTLEWEYDNFWEGTLQEEERQGFTWNLIHVLEQSTAARYLKVELVDPNNPDGYVQLGRMFLADEWQPAINMELGASITYESRSEIDEAVSGTEYYEEREAPRVAQFTLGMMSEDEAMARALDMQRVVGTTREVLYMYNKDDTTHRLRRAFLGRLRRLSPVEQPYLQHFRAGFEIKELL
jgi:hypothetical protein